MKPPYFKGTLKQLHALLARVKKTRSEARHKLDNSPRGRPKIRTVAQRRAIKNAAQRKRRQRQREGLKLAREQEEILKHDSSI